ncbi:MAG: hypothetical protein JWN34_1132, partial [Bryobacterales bacterium]|nr:hypothetical protein [Bryobacterales bacterium]
MKLAACLISLALGASVASAQQFEVASVKVSGPDSIRGSEGGPGSKDPTRYIFGRVRLRSLLMMAWEMADFQLSGKFDLERDEFDLAAKLPPGTTNEEFRVMLRNLLAERFHLKTHLETREFPVLALEVAESGQKLRESAGKSEPIPRAWLDAGFPDFPLDRPAMTTQNSRAVGNSLLVRVKGQQQTLQGLGDLLRGSAGQPVVNATGMNGKFDFTLEFAVDTPGVLQNEAIEAPPAASLNVALKQQLGLQLVRRRLPFPVLV